MGVGGLDGGGDVGNVEREEAAGGRAALAVSRVVSGAGEARLAREEVCVNVYTTDATTYNTQKRNPLSRARECPVQRVGLDDTKLRTA